MAAGRSITEFPGRIARIAPVCRSIFVTLTLLWVLLIGNHTARAAAQTPSEYQVKAAFLLNFTKFVDWPDWAFASPEAAISICILGDDPFGSGLDRIIEGETVNNRRLSIQRLRKPPATGCHVVFIGREEKDAGRILAGINAGVLTVGEGEPFLRAGGMIAFVIDNRRVRFDINQPAAANAGLQISSKLLSVARNVEK